MSLCELRDLREPTEVASLENYQQRMLTLVSALEAIQDLWKTARSLTEAAARERLAAASLSQRGSLAQKRERVFRYEALNHSKKLDVPWDDGWDILGEEPVDGLDESALVYCANSENDSPRLGSSTPVGSQPDANSLTTPVALQRVEPEWRSELALLEERLTRQIQDSLGPILDILRTIGNVAPDEGGRGSREEALQVVENAVEAERPIVVAAAACSVGALRSPRTPALAAHTLEDHDDQAEKCRKARRRVELPESSDEYDELASESVPSSRRNERVERRGDGRARNVVPGHIRDLRAADSDGSRNRVRWRGESQNVAQPSIGERAHLSARDEPDDREMGRRNTRGNRRVRREDPDATLAARYLNSSASDSEDAAVCVVGDRRRRIAEVERRIALVEIFQNWGLKFSGEGDRDGPGEFILRLNEARRTLHISDEDVLHVLPFLLSQSAGRWYRTLGRQCGSWREFRKLFRYKFMGRLNQRDLEYELMQRTQGKGESITGFLDSLVLIAQSFRRPPMPEYLLEIAFRNLLPEYRHYVANKEIRDLNDLEYYGQEWERLRDLDLRYQPPPPKEKCRIPAAAFVPSTKRK